METRWILITENHTYFLSLMHYSEEWVESGMFYECAPVCPVPNYKTGAAAVRWLNEQLES